MAQQTAVDWLDNELWKIRLKLRGGEISIGLYSEKEVELIEQAKQMEKKQIVNAVSVGYDYCEDGKVRWMGEQYYNETYGTTNSNEVTDQHLGKHQEPGS